MRIDNRNNLGYVGYIFGESLESDFMSGLMNIVKVTPASKLRLEILANYRSYTGGLGLSICVDSSILWVRDNQAMVAKMYKKDTTNVQLLRANNQLVEYYEALVSIKQSIRPNKTNIPPNRAKYPTNRPNIRK